MTRTGSVAALLHAAVQDIHAGLTDQAARLPAKAAHDPELRALLDAERARSAERATRLDATGVDPAGPACLWMAGVLDDAARDARSTQPGRLLDITIAGAIRKGKVAEAAACDTAIALARTLVDRPLETVAASIKAEATGTAAALLAIIERLAAHEP